MDVRQAPILFILWYTIPMAAASSKNGAECDTVESSGLLQIKASESKKQNVALGDLVNTRQDSWRGDDVADPSKQMYRMGFTATSGPVQFSLNVMTFGLAGWKNTSALTQHAFRSLGDSEDQALQADFMSALSVASGLTADFQGDDAFWLEPSTRFLGAPTPVHAAIRETMRRKNATFNGFDQSPFSNLSSWMGDLFGDGFNGITLKRVVLPGSHDAGCNDRDDWTTTNSAANSIWPLRGLGYDTAVTQTLYLDEQLEKGVRYFDVRFDRLGKGEYRIVHGGYLFDTAVNSMNRILPFCKRHPSELIVIRYKCYQDDAGKDLLGSDGVITKLSNEVNHMKPSMFSGQILKNLPLQKIFDDATAVPGACPIISLVHKCKGWDTDTYWDYESNFFGGGAGKDTTSVKDIAKALKKDSEPWRS